MKKKILTIVAIVLVVVTALTAFTACKSDYVNVSALTLNEEANASAERTATKIDVGQGYTYMWATSNLIAFRKSEYNSATSSYETSYAVVNGKTGANILSGNDKPDYIITTDYTVEMEGLFYTESAETGTVSFFSLNGIIVSGIDTTGLIDSYGRITASRISDGKMDLGNGQVIVEDEEGLCTLQQKEVSISGSVDKDDTVETENYWLYAYSLYEFAAYEKNTMTKVRDFNIADITGDEYSSARYYTPILLPDDKLLVQVMTSLPANTTKDYDYYSGDTYYKIRTFIYDIAKGKTSEKKDCDYVFASGGYHKEAGVTICSVRRIGDDKQLNATILQGFDGKLNIALDVQSILPLANKYSVRGDYVIFKNDSKTVYYKGDNKVFEVETANMNAVDTYLSYSDIFVSSDGATLFNANGSYLTSLADLGATSFVSLDHAKQYVYYYKTDTDSLGAGKTNLYRLDRNTGTTSLVAESGSYNMAQSVCGFYIVEDTAQTGVYKVVDIDTGKTLISGLSGMTAQYVCSTDESNVFGFTFANEATDTDEMRYYVIN